MAGDPGGVRTGSRRPQEAPPRPDLGASGPGERVVRRWRSALFAPVGDGQRRRRGSDGMRLAIALVVLACCVLIIHYNSRIDRAIVAVINPPPRSITWLVTVVYQAGSFGVVALVVLIALAARRWVIVRDIAVSAALTAAASGPLPQTSPTTSAQLPSDCSKTS